MKKNKTKKNPKCKTEWRETPSGFESFTVALPEDDLYTLKVTKEEIKAIKEGKEVKQ